MSSQQPDSPGKTNCPDTNCVWHQTPGNYEMSRHTFSDFREQLFQPGHRHFSDSAPFKLLLPKKCPEAGFCQAVPDVPRASLLVMTSHFALLLKRRLLNPPLTLPCKESADPQGKEGTENVVGLECRKLHPSLLVLLEGLLDVHPTEDEIYWSSRQLPWTRYQLYRAS